MIWLEIAWRNVRRHGSRSAFVVLVSCTGVSAVLLSVGYMLSAFEAVRESNIRGGLGHLQIAREQEFGGYSERPMQHGLDPSAVARIRAAATNLLDDAILLPRVEFQRVASSGDRTVIFLGEGVEPNEERRLSRFFVQIAEGRGLEQAGDKLHVAVLGKEMARLLGVKVGETITLMSPTEQSGLNAVDVEVVGLAVSGSPVHDRTRVVVPLALSQFLVRTDKISRMVIGLDSTDLTGTIHQRLSPQVAGLAVRSWSELAVFYHQLVDLYSRQFAVLGVVIVIVVILTLTNSILISVIERTREIGTLLAMGIRHSSIRLQFILEGLLLGIGGGALGTVISLGLILGINALEVQMPAPPGQTMGYPLHFTFSIPAAVAVSLSCAGLGALSAFLASRRITSASPLQALNHA